MAITIDRLTSVIHVPQGDLTPLGGNVYEFDTEAFRLTLKSIEASEEGIVFSDTHDHFTEVTLAGVTYARIIRIIPPYTVEFEDLQYNVRAVGSNHNIEETKVLNQVSLTTGNSAGLIKKELSATDLSNVANATWDQLNTDNVASNTKGLAIALVEYGGAIWISNTGSTGTVIGLNGKPSNPVNNLSDAAALSAATGLNKYVIISGSYTLTSSLTEWDVVLKNESELNFGNQNVNGSTFEGGILKGTISTGTIKVTGSILEDIDNFQGFARWCGFSGTNTLATGESTFAQCHSQEPGTGTPTLDFVGPGRTVNLRAYSGGMKFENMVDATNICTAEYIAGQAIVDSSCVAGTLVIRGNAEPITDNSLGTTINTDAVLVFPGSVR